MLQESSRQNAVKGCYVAPETRLCHRDLIRSCLETWAKSICVATCPRADTVLIKQAPRWFSPLSLSLSKSSAYCVHKTLKNECHTRSTCGSKLLLPAPPASPPAPPPTHNPGAALPRHGSTRVSPFFTPVAALRVERCRLPTEACHSGLADCGRSCRCWG